RDLLLVRNPEGRAAAAGGDDVRVVDLEACSLQVVDVVDRRALHVRQARAVDEQADALVLEDLVPVALLVERERVLEAGAAAARTPTRRPAVSISLPWEARNSWTFAAPLSVSV